MKPNTEEGQSFEATIYMMVGIISTILALFLLVGFAISGEQGFLSLKLNEKGDYIAGFSGFLAFIWLFIAVRLQSIELAAQRKEMAMQREELNTANRHHADQVEEMTLARKLSEKQLIQANHEFLLLEKQHIEKHKDIMLENICYQIWYEITNFFQYSQDFSDFYTKDQKTIEIENALSNKNFNLSLRLIMQFYISFSQTIPCLKVRDNARDNYFGEMSYGHFNIQLIVLLNMIFDYIQINTANNANNASNYAIFARLMFWLMGYERHDRNTLCFLEIDLSNLPEKAHNTLIDLLVNQKENINCYFPTTIENFNIFIQNTQDTLRQKLKTSQATPDDTPPHTPASASPDLADAEG